jgi:DNA-binding HxlR family transcriptional regulator
MPRFSALLEAPLLSLDVSAHVAASIVPAVLDVLGQRWSLAIVQALLLVGKSFGQLLAELDAPRSTLAARLKHLQAMNCVEACAQGYQLTPAGQALLAVVSLARDWDARRGVPVPVPAALQHSCGQPLQASLRCGHCQQPVAVRDIQLHGAGVAPSAAHLGKPLKRARAEFAAESQLSAASILADRWTALIVALIYFGVQRYGDLARHLQIAPNILADRLLRLTEGGVLLRETDGASSRPLYRFSAEGLQLFPLIVALTDWGDQWLRPQYQASTQMLHRPCGQPLQAQLHCACCGERVTLASLSAPVGAS